MVIFYESRAIGNKNQNFKIKTQNNRSKDLEIGYESVIKTYLRMPNSQILNTLPKLPTTNT